MMTNFLSPEEWDELDDVAELFGTTRQSLVRKALLPFLHYQPCPVCADTGKLVVTHLTRLGDQLFAACPACDRRRA